jgi:hypothetical protein
MLFLHNRSNMLLFHGRRLVPDHQVVNRKPALDEPRP